MILVWGVASDPPIAAVWAALSKLGRNCLLLDQRDILETGLELAAAPSLAGKISGKNMVLDLASVTGCYVRPENAHSLACVSEASDTGLAFAHAHAFDEALLGWLDMAEARILNRPSAMSSNASKPFQQQLIEKAGFSTPVTLVTTDREEAQAFWRTHGEIICKSVSGVRSIVFRLGDAHKSRFDNLSTCPTQLQEYVEGTDVRVHVVGRKLFASEIVCRSDDYRYASRSGDDVDIKACQLPEPVAERCLSLAASLDLPFSGIDLRRDKSGDWYCFEVNPSPGFTYYENFTGQPIAEAVAGYLCGETIEGKRTR